MTHVVTGPQDVTYAEVAAAIAVVAGLRVEYEPVEPGVYEARLLAAGLPTWRAFDLAHIAAAYAGADHDASPALGALLGREPRSLRASSPITAPPSGPPTRRPSPRGSRRRRRRAMRLASSAVSVRVGWRRTSRTSTFFWPRRRPMRAIAWGGSSAPASRRRPTSPPRPRARRRSSAARGPGRPAPRRSGRPRPRSRGRAASAASRCTAR